MREGGSIWGEGPTFGYQEWGRIKLLCELAQLGNVKRRDSRVVISTAEKEHSCCRAVSNEEKRVEKWKSFYSAAQKRQRRKIAEASGDKRVVQAEMREEETSWQRATILTITRRENERKRKKEG